jgi:hypothetical protein
MTTVTEARRVLVLEARKVNRLWREGGSLVVGAQSRSPLRFPFRRLEAIYVVGNLGRGLDALVGAASEGIPVYFFGGRGAIKATLMNPARNDGPLRQQLEWLRMLGNGDCMLQQWLDDNWRHELSQLGVRLEPDTKPDDIEEGLWPTWLSRMPARRVGHYRQHLDSWQYARVSRMLRQIHINPETLLGQWVMKPILPRIRVMVMVRLRQEAELPNPETSSFYWALSGIDLWLRDRLSVWLIRLELALDEWRDGVA